MAVCRLVKRIPSHQNGAWLFRLVQSQQEICETDDRATALVACSPDRFWQAVIGTMGKRVAIDDEQWFANERGRCRRLDRFCAWFSTPDRTRAVTSFFWRSRHAVSNRFATEPIPVAEVYPWRDALLVAPAN